MTNRSKSSMLAIFILDQPASNNAVSSAVNSYAINNREISDIFSGVRFNNNSDAVSILSSGVPEGDAAVLIAGTGTVVYCRIKEQYHRIGGWGHLFDEGLSGYDIGRDGLHAVLKSDD